MTMAAQLSLRHLEEPARLALSEVSTRASRIISPRTGIVSSVELVETGVCDPTVYWARARQADTTAIFGVRARNDGNASALEPTAAAVKAVGESIERYCASFWDPEALPLSTYRNLDEPAVPPESWALFGEAQLAQPEFPVRPFTEESAIRWSLGFSLTQDKPIRVPAAFVHIPYTIADGEERILPWQVSTGLAAHTSLARASLKALLEVVERDAFMLFWHRRIRCPEIDVSALPSSDLRDLFERTRVPGYTCSLRLLTLDIPLPIVLAVMTSNDHKPYVVMGCSADCNPEVAVRLALEEVLLSLHGITGLAEAEPIYTPKGEPYSDIDDLLLHAWVYAVDPALRDVVASQLEPDGKVNWENLPRGPSGSTLIELRWLVGELATRGLESIVVDLTTVDIDEIGFKVVRGLVPGMQPLDVDHRYIHLGGRRLYQSPESLGVSRGRVAAKLNPYPHPFP